MEKPCPGKNRFVLAKCHFVLAEIFAKTDFDQETLVKVCLVLVSWQNIQFLVLLKNKNIYNFTFCSQPELLIFAKTQDKTPFY
jgi:hypothetical protein